MYFSGSDIEWMVPVILQNLGPSDCEGKSQVCSTIYLGRGREKIATMLLLVG